LKLTEKFRTISNPWVFSLFFNLWAILKFKRVRCAWIPSLGVFQVQCEGETRLASVNSRVLSYSDGFALRSAYIGQTYMLSSISFREGDLVVDCGANMGDLEFYLRENAPKVRYVGFEPNPKDFICLERNVGASRSRNIGLWNKEGSIPFYVNDAHASSSFIQPPDFTQLINIPASTLSIQFPNERIRLLKLEAEGAEPEVLEGAISILTRIDYVSADVGPERGIHEKETRDLVVNLLESNGFELIKESRDHRKIILMRQMALPDTINSKNLNVADSESY
jgi:FkbM family methyltransferase